MMPSSHDEPPNKTRVSPGDSSQSPASASPHQPTTGEKLTITTNDPSPAKSRASARRSASAARSQLSMNAIFAMLDSKWFTFHNKWRRNQNGTGYLRYSPAPV